MIIEINIKEYMTVIKPYKKLSSVQLGAVVELVDTRDLEMIDFNHSLSDTARKSVLEPT